MANFLSNFLQGISSSSDQWPQAYGQYQQNKRQKESALRTEALQRLGLVQQYVDAGHPEMAQTVFEQTIQGPWAEYVPPDVIQRYQQVAPQYDDGQEWDSKYDRPATPANRITQLFASKKKELPAFQPMPGVEGVMYRNQPDGTVEYNESKYYQSTRPKKVSHVDDETGIVTFDDGTTQNPTPSVLEVLNKKKFGQIQAVDWDTNRYMTKDGQIHSYAGAETGLTSKTAKEINNLMMKGFEYVSNAQNPLPPGQVEHLIRAGMSNLKMTPQQQDQAWNQYAPIYAQFAYKVPWNDQEKKNYDHSIFLQDNINDIMTLLKADPTVQQMMGKVSGNLSNFKASLSGNRTLTPGQLRFKQSLDNLEDLVIRNRTGAVVNSEELKFYQNLMGSNTMALPAMTTLLDNMFDLSQLQINALYKAGLMQKDPQNWSTLMGNVPMIKKIYLGNPDSIPGGETPESLIHGGQ